MFQKQRLILLMALLAGPVLLVGCGDDEDPTPVAPPPEPPPTAPAAPANVQATLDAGAGIVSVTWNASTNANTYAVQRRVGDGDAETLASGIAGTSHVDEDAAWGMAQYAVTATGTGGTSSASAAVEVGYGEEALFLQEAWANRVDVDPMLGNPFDRESPDFRPQAGSPALEGAATVADLTPMVLALPPEVTAAFAAAAPAFFDGTANYVGAVGPDQDWTQETWTTFGEAGMGDMMASGSAVLSGNISDVRMLSADTAYTINGIVTVEGGGELHIPAGTHLYGSTEIQPSALIVRVGGKLFSEGTEDAPVVFTSANPPEERLKGDWGGVVLNGASLCNFPAGECVGEGSSGEYGGDNRADDSGVVTYTRIEYAGFEVSFGNELNALTMNGVGNGTTIHHVQTHAGSDDGFEWFGGTVNTKYLLATDISDDSFDYSTGFQGMGQFWLAQQDPNDGDNGFEVDGNEDDYNATPYTLPLLANITLIGKGVDGAGGTEGESVDGLRLRRGTGGIIANALIIGFGDDGLDIDNGETAERAKAGMFAVTYSIIDGNAAAFERPGS